MKNRTKSYDISSFKNLSINGKISLFGGNAGKNNEEKKRMEGGEVEEEEEEEEGKRMNCKEKNTAEG